MPTVIGAKECKARLSAQPTGAYLFFGEEEHLKRVYLSRFRALVTENPEFNTTRLEVGESDPIGEVAYEMGRLPFLSEMRFLDVRGLALHRLSDKEVERFHALLSDCPPDLIVVFYFFECDLPFAGTIPKSQKKLKDLPVFQNLPEGVTVVNFTHPTASELFAYYDAKFKSRKVSASREVVELFCARAKGNMKLLENESEKLVALALSGDGVLTREMIDEALPELSETMIYKLSDAVENADAARAISEYRILRTMKFEPIPLLASLARTVANLSIARGTLSEMEAEKQFGIKPYRFRALKARAAKLSPSSLASCQAMVSDVDRNLKNTALDADVMLETLIVRLCTTLGGRA